jgi:hypothetical protein
LCLQQPRLCWRQLIQRLPSYVSSHINKYNQQYFQVDDRLNGDGTGLPLGINDGALGIVLSTVPLLIFALYFTAGKRDGEIIAGGENDDSGLSL